MGNEDMTQDLIRRLRDRGYRARVVKIERLGELKAEIETRRADDDAVFVWESND